MVLRYFLSESSPAEKAEVFFSSNGHMNAALRYMVFLIFTVYVQPLCIFFVSSLCKTHLLHTMTNGCKDAAVESKYSVQDFQTPAASELVSKCHRTTVCCKHTDLY